MKTFVIFCLVGCASLSLVNGEGVRTPSEKDTSLLDEILKKITSSIANVKAISASKGFYEVVDDGSIHFVRSTTPDAAAPTTNPTTSEPSLSDDESEKDYVDGGEEEGTYWEFVPRRVTVHDPLKDEEDFPLVDTNEVEADEESVKKAASKFAILERRRRDVNVDVGGSHGVDVAVNKPGKNVAVNVGGHGGSGSSSGVDVAVNKPGSNVAVNVGGIQDFLSQFGIHFNGGKPSGTYGASGASYGGSGGNVDVNVGGKPGHNNNVDVSVNKPHKGNTNVAVDWASFIPFVNVGVNKKNGGSKVDVNVGQNGGSAGASLVDVQVDKGEGKHVQGSKKVIVRAPFVDVNVDGEAGPAGSAAGDASSHKKKVVVHAPFVDLDIDGDFPPPPHHPPHHPHHPPKKHHYRQHPHDDGDKNVAVNVGGQSNGAWWPFVNVNVDSDNKASHGKAAGKKCVKINVPFVNVLLNRSGCDEEEAGPSSA